MKNKAECQEAQAESDVQGAFALAYRQQLEQCNEEMIARRRWWGRAHAGMVGSLQKYLESRTTTVLIWGSAKSELPPLNSELAARTLIKRLDR